MRSMATTLGTILLALAVGSACGSDTGGDDDVTPGIDAAAGGIDGPVGPGNPDGAPGAPDAPAPPEIDGAPAPDIDAGGGTDVDGGTPTLSDAFRASTLALRDPHVYFGGLGCSDVTDTPLFGFSVNGQIATTVTTDADGDGYLDLSLAVVFRPLDQAAAGGDADIGIADCTAPIGSTSCSADPGAPLEGTTYTNMAAGVCMMPYAGTVSTAGYVPAITSPSGPCFVTAAASLTVDIAGVAVPLQDVQAAAHYDGTPATGLSSGLVRGFISEEDAAAVLVPIPVFGDTPLNTLLPGDPANCADQDDRDVGLDGVTSGWWFYFNFTADAVPFSG